MRFIVPTTPTHLIVLLLSLFSLAGKAALPQPYGQLNSLNGVTQSLCVRSITQSEDGMMWFGAEDGLYSFDGYHLLKRDGAPRGMGCITRLKSEGDSLRIDYERGQTCFDLRTYTFSPAHPHPQRVGSKFQDSSSNLQSSIFNLQSPTSDTIMAGGRWWVGTPRQVSEWNKDTDTQGFTLEVPVTKVMCADARGNLLVGTDNGLFIVQPNLTVHHILHDARLGTSLAGDVVWSLFRDRDDNIWIGTNCGISLAVMDSRQTTYTLPSITGESTGNQLSAMGRDMQGRYWMGGTGGIIRIDHLGEEGQTYRWYRMGDTHSPLPHNRIRIILTDSQGNVWVGGDGGLLRYDEATQQFERYPIEGDAHNWVYGLEETTQSQLIVTTFDATYTVLPDITSKHLDIKQKHSKKKGASNGEKRYHDTINHQWLVGGIDCFTIVREDLGTNHTPSRPMRITDIMVNGDQWVSHEDIIARQVTLAPDKRFLQFYISDFNFADTPSEDYVYSIDGGKTWWPVNATDHTLTLSQLEPGTYQLHMCQKKEGTDTEADGKENSTSLLFTFTIRAPWYATTLAKIIYVLLMMILICATYYIVRQQRRIRHERKERAHLLAQARQKEQELLSDNEYLAGQLRLRLMEQSSSEEELSGDEKFLLNITRLIEENMDNTELNVNLLSQKSGISTKQLYRRIKSLTGMTAVAYIRDQRLKKAASLLAKDSFTVSEVMYRVGFSSPSYFTRCFCDEYGVPPSEYKTEES